LENENAIVKKKSKGLLIGIIAAAVVIIAAAAVLFILKPWSVDVATVDNLKVTKYEYAFFTKFGMNQFISTNNLTNTTTPDTYKWDTKKGTETAKDAVKKSTLEQIQEFKIQLIKAKEAGYKLDSKDLENIDAAINEQITNYGSRNAAEAGVKNDYGVTLSELKDIYKNLTLAQKYRDSITSKVVVSDDDVKKYYDDNKANFDKVTVTHILISTLDSSTQAPVSAGKKAEAKKRAEELLAKVRAGEDITALAEKNSEDPGVTQNKGEYTFGRGEMVPSFEEWAFKDHKAGDSDIVESDYGYHVMQFHKRASTPFDDLKENIKSSLLAQKQSEEFTKKIDELKKDNKYAIKTKDDAIAKVDKTLYKM